MIPLSGSVGGSTSQTPVLVQQTSTSTCIWSSGSTFPCVLGSTPSASNVLLFSGGEAVPTTLTPTSTGATWTQLVSGTVGGYNTIWCATLTGVPGTTITITEGSSGNDGRGNVSEWSGLTCTSDGTSNAGATSGTTYSTTAIATTHASDLILASVNHASGGTILTGPTNSFVSMNSPAINFQAAYLVVASTGSYSTTWTYSTSSQYQTAAAALKSK